MGVGGWQKIGENYQKFGKSSQNSCKAKKCQNIYTKAQFESPKHLHQITFEPLKRSQQTMLCQNVKKSMYKKVAQNCCRIFGQLFHTQNWPGPIKSSQNSNISLNRSP
jgi:hypothetical protein